MFKQSFKSGATTADDLAIHLTQFIATLAKAGYAEKTRHEKVRMIKHFIRWGRETGIAMADVDNKLLDDHIYSEIADFLNEQGFRPEGSARSERGNSRASALRVAYLVHRYGLRSRYNRLRKQGMLTKDEAAARLRIHVQTIISWAEHGIATRRVYNGHAYLYEPPGRNPPDKQCSRWNRLIDRAAAV